MAKLALPFIALRTRPDGTIRPRFVPGARERDLGFRGEDLRHPDGRWYSVEEASQFAADRHDEIIAARQKSASGCRPKASPGRRLCDLLDDWLASDDVKALSPATQLGYRKQISAILYKPRTRAQRRADLLAGRDAELEPTAHTPVKAIGSPELKGFFLYQKATRGLHMARASIAVISAAMTWGRTSTKWRLGTNPRLGITFEQAPPRVVVYSMAEIDALVAAADAMGRPSIGDAIVLGLYTGQRQGDRLALEDLGLTSGRRIFRQSKTGAIVAILEAPALAARLAAAAKRAAEVRLRLGARPDVLTVIVSEATGAAYSSNGYRHLFDDVRALAAKEMPSLAGKRDQDLRDTTVTWMANGEAELPEIAAVTGHSLASITTIMKHYLAITPELGDKAITKMLAWMERQGIAV